MAIVEAASCGLQVVSTKVGGIPEVLPSNLIILTEPDVDSVLEGLLLAIERQKLHRNCVKNMSRATSLISNHKSKKKSKIKDATNKLNDQVICPFKCNEIVANLYNWENVSERTEQVYRRVLNEKDPNLGEKLHCYQQACVPFMLVVSFCYLWLQFLNWWHPMELIDVARDFQQPSTKHLITRSNGISNHKLNVKTKENKKIV